MEVSNREVIILPGFRDSLIGIWDYIANDSMKNADRFISDLEIVMQRIEHFPESNPMFQPLAGKRKLYRYKIYKKNYLIVFKLLNNRLIYINIVHSKRNPDYYKTLRTFHL